MYIFDPLGITSNMCATLRLVSRLIVRTSRRMTSTFARLANRFFCTGISHVYVWMCMDRTNQRWKKEKKRKQTKTKHKNAQQRTSFDHSFYTVTYDTICREKKRLPTWERLFTYYNFLSFVQQLGIDLYRTNLSSENDITIDSKTAWYKYFLSVTRMKLRVFPSYRNKIIR